MPPKRQPPAAAGGDAAAAVSASLSASSTTGTSSSASLSPPTATGESAPPPAVPPPLPPPAKAPRLTEDDADDDEAPAARPKPKPGGKPPPAAADDGDDGEGTEEEGDEGDDPRPVCFYGLECYRKNPDHFRAFKHPKQHSMAIPYKTTASIGKKRGGETGGGERKKLREDGAGAAAATTTTAGDDAYVKVLRVMLKGKMRLTADDKRSIRELRKEMEVSDAQHGRAVRQLGWTMEEYEDGEKRDDGTELERERQILAPSGSGFEIIAIKHGNKARTKDEDVVFSRCATMFFQTMSKAQANYRITEVRVVVNRELRQQYNAYRQTLLEAKHELNEDWVFHGTSVASVLAIAKTGFLHPDKLPKADADDDDDDADFASDADDDAEYKGKKPAAKAKGAAAAAKKKKGGGGAAAAKKKAAAAAAAKKKKKAAAKGIEILDDGYFGKGIYFSAWSDYAMFYSEERESNQILLCQVLKGRSFKCEERMDGLGCKKGYHSHYSPKGNEVVLFEPDQILPRYIIVFDSQPAEEREQED